MIKTDSKRLNNLIDNCSEERVELNLYSSKRVNEYLKDNNHVRVIADLITEFYKGNLQKSYLQFLRYKFEINFYEVLIDYLAKDIKVYKDSNKDFLCKFDFKKKISYEELFLNHVHGEHYEEIEGNTKKRTRYNYPLFI